MNKTLIHLVIAAVYGAVMFGAGWQVRVWQDTTKKLSEQTSAIKEGAKVQGELNGVFGKLSEGKVDMTVKFNVLNEDIVRYVQTPNRVEYRNECRFPDERLRVKSEAVNAANGIKRPDGRAL
jgi:DNA-binding transcriptional regulator of glucitol operon